MPVKPRCCFCGKEYYRIFARKGYGSAVSVKRKKELFFMFKRTCQYCIHFMQRQPTKFLLSEMFDTFDSEIIKDETEFNIRKWLQEKIPRIFLSKFKLKMENMSQPPTQSCFKYLSMKNGRLIYEKNPRIQNIFLPKIDKDLFPRFIATLSGFEHYIFALSSKEASRMINLKSLIITKTMKLSNEQYYISNFGENVLVTENFSLSNIDSNSNAVKNLCQNFFTAIKTNTLIINAKYIELIDLQIFANNFFLLLSPNTIVLKCVNVKFVTSLKIFTFAQKLPNLQKLFFYSNNVKFDIFGIQILQNNCHDLQRFIITLTDDGIKFLSDKKSMENVFVAEQQHDSLKQKLSTFAIKIDRCDLHAIKMNNI